MKNYLRAKYDFSRLEKVLTWLSSRKNDRNEVYVTFNIKTIDDDTGKAVMAGYFTMKPDELASILNKYGVTIKILDLLYYDEKIVPIQGACDSRPHVVKMYFDCDDQKLSL